MDYWTEATRRVRFVNAVEVISWTAETTSMRDAFDDLGDDVEEMIERCLNYTDTHYQVRVQIFIDGKVFGESHLGSCYASNCTPEEDIANGVGGYLPQLIEQATAEVVSSLTRMRRILEDVGANIVDIPATSVNLEDVVGITTISN